MQLIEPLIGSKLLWDDAPDSPGVRQFRFAGRWSELAAEYEFFTHAPLFAPGMLERDPLEDYISRQELSADKHPGYLQAEQAIFAESGSFTSRLHLCPREHWLTCRDFLASIRVIDRLRNRFLFAAHSAIEIFDPSVISQHTGDVAAVPTLSVTVFCSIVDPDVYFMAPTRIPSDIFRPPVLAKSLAPQHILDAAHACHTAITADAP